MPWHIGNNNLCFYKPYTQTVMHENNQKGDNITKFRPKFAILAQYDWFSRLLVVYLPWQRLTTQSKYLQKQFDHICKGILHVFWIKQACLMLFITIFRFFKLWFVWRALEAVSVKSSLNLPPGPNILIQKQISIKNVGSKAELASNTAILSIPMEKYPCKMVQNLITGKNGD